MNWEGYEVEGQMDISEFLDDKGVSMTENEAMKNLETLERFYRIAKSGSALHEVLINFVTLEDLVVAIQALEEIQKYRAIGTVEEFKALKEKNVAKKPRFYAHNYYCTECGNLVGNNEFEWQRFLYCDKCGQKLDWE